MLGKQEAGRLGGLPAFGGSGVTDGRNGNKKEAGLLNNTLIASLVWFVYPENAALRSGCIRLSIPLLLSWPLRRSKPLRRSFPLRLSRPVLLSGI